MTYFGHVAESTFVQCTAATDLSDELQRAEGDHGSNESGISTPAPVAPQDTSCGSQPSSRSAPGHPTTGHLAAVEGRNRYNTARLPGYPHQAVAPAEAAASVVFRAAAEAAEREAAERYAQLHRSPVQKMNCDSAAAAAAAAGNGPLPTSSPCETPKPQGRTLAAGLTNPVISHSHTPGPILQSRPRSAAAVTAVACPSGGAVRIRSRPAEWRDSSRFLPLQQQVFPSIPPPPSPLLPTPRGAFCAFA